MYCTIGSGTSGCRSCRSGLASPTRRMDREGRECTLAFFVIHIASKVALGLSVLRQQNIRILQSLFRTTHTPADRRYTCHALMSADFFRVSQYFVRKSYSTSIKIRKNPYVWRLWIHDSRSGSFAGGIA